LTEIALTIAGSDSSAGAGIQADLKTFAAHKIYGVCVITALTAQNTTNVFKIFKIPLDMIEAQLDALFEDFTISSIKTGMLPSAEIIALVANKLSGLNVPIVVDPIIQAGVGRDLIEKEAINEFISRLFPIATLVTPNIFEAESFSGVRVKSESDLKVSAQKMIEKGVKAILIKGGHLNVPEVVDFLFLKNGKQKVFRKTRVQGQTRHGTGCVLSAAIAANLADKMDLAEAVDRAEKYIDMIFPETLKLGHGNPPINPFSKSL
jgi:hydroxymethylpyrimidine/phosphomethylpyrimidine kinase